MKKRMFEIFVIRYSRTLHPSYHSRMILSGIQSLLGVLMILVGIGVMASPAEGLIIESPKEGETLVIGKPFMWKIRLEEGEICETINLEHPPFNPTTRTYEWTDTIKPEDDMLNKQTFAVMGDPSTCNDAEVTVHVVLSPTTVVKEIEAAIDGEEKSFMTLYKHDNGKSILTSRGVDEVTANALYSDGIWRDVSAHPDTTYTSSDEKVLKVTPPGKWTINDEFPQFSRKKENERPGTGALVTAVGSGMAKITVRHGSFEDSVTGIVDVKPCSEWKKRALKEALPVCD